MIKIKRDGVIFYVSSKEDALYKVFIDIGSAIGAISLFAAKLYPMTFGFDPNPVAYKIFMKNLRLNKYKNFIKNFNYAVTAEDKNEKFVSGKLFSEINFNRIKSGNIIKCISLKNF